MSGLLSDVVAALVASTGLAIGAAMAAFLLLFAALHVCAQTMPARPEMTRKLLHTGSGLLTLTFPFLFREVWPVLLLTGASALIVASASFVPAVRARFGGVTGRVERTTFGEIYFPLGVLLLFTLTRGMDPLLFVIPVLVLTLADTAGAVVGTRVGRTCYANGSKSLEGSVAFAVVAFVCVHVPLLIWSTLGRTESLLVAATLGLLVMLLEGSASRGRDNLAIPLGAYFLLRGSLELDTAALLARLAATLTLVCLVVLLNVDAARPKRAPGRAVQGLRRWSIYT